MPTKIKLRLEGRALRRSPGVISNVIRTAILAPLHDSHPVATVIRREQRVVAGSPRTHHSRRKRRRNVNCKPPPRGKSYAPITQPVAPRQYRPCTGPTPAPKPNTRDASTQIDQHSKILPRAGTFTRGDKVKQQSVSALERLKKATRRGVPWSSQMIVILLRFMFGLIVHFNWGWTQAVYTTSKLCCVKHNTLFKFANSYIQSDEIIPVQMSHKVRGRGSLKFISNHGKDYYSNLKEVEHVL